MKTINIASAIDELMIFDDPEYCHDYNCEDFCGFLGDDRDCKLFGVDLKATDEHHEIKYDACKAAWNKTKKQESTASKAMRLLGLLAINSVEEKPSVQIIKEFFEKEF